MRPAALAKQWSRPKPTSRPVSGHGTDICSKGIIRWLFWTTKKSNEANITWDRLPAYRGFGSTPRDIVGLLEITKFLEAPKVYIDMIRYMCFEICATPCFGWCQSRAHVYYYDLFKNVNGTYHTWYMIQYNTWYSMIHNFPHIIYKNPSTTHMHRRGFSWTLPSSEPAVGPNVRTPRQKFCTRFFEIGQARFWRLHRLTTCAVWFGTCTDFEHVIEINLWLRISLGTEFYWHPGQEWEIPERIPDAQGSNHRAAQTDGRIDHQGWCRYSCGPCSWILEGAQGRAEGRLGCSQPGQPGSYPVCFLWWFCKDTWWWHQDCWDIYYLPSSLATKKCTQWAMVPFCLGGTQTLRSPHHALCLAAVCLLRQPAVQWRGPWWQFKVSGWRPKICGHWTQRWLAMA